MHTIIALRAINIWPFLSFLQRFYKHFCVFYFVCWASSFPLCPKGAQRRHPEYEIWDLDRLPVASRAASTRSNGGILNQSNEKIYISFRIFHPLSLLANFQQTRWKCLLKWNIIGLFSSPNYWFNLYLQVGTLEFITDFF